jgi:hypothetical protein
VHNARGAAHNLDAIHVVSSEMTEVEIATNGVHWNAVDQHFRVTALTTSEKE